MLESTMYHYILNTNSRIHVGSSTWIGLFARSHQLLRVLERFCLTWWESRGHNHDNHVWIHLQDWDSPSWLSAQMEMAKVSQTFAFWQMLYMHLDISPVCFVQKVALDLTHTHVVLEFPTQNMHVKYWYITYQKLIRATVPLELYLLQPWLLYFLSDLCDCFGSSFPGIPVSPTFVW